MSESESQRGKERGRWGKAMLADTEIKATVVLFSPSFIARRVRCKSGLSGLDSGGRLKL